MTTQVVYPSASGNVLVSPWANTAGTYPANLGDGVDTNFVSAVSGPGVTTPTWLVKCDSWDPYASGWIATTTVTIRMRLSAGGSGGIGFNFGNMDTGGILFLNYAGWAPVTLTGDGAWRDYSFTLPNNYAWKSGQTGAGVALQPAIMVRGGVAQWTGTLDITAVSFTFTSQPYYTYSFTSPAATTPTSKILVTATVTGSSGDGSALQHYVAVYPSTVYGVGGFDPQAAGYLAQASWSGTFTGSSLSTGYLPPTLTPGVSYRVYVWGVVPGSSGFWGTTGYVQTVLGITGPPAPEVSAGTLVWNAAIGYPPAQSVSCTVYPRHNLLTLNQSSVETDTTGFTALSNCSIARDTTVYDWTIGGTASLKVTCGVGDAFAGTLAGTSGVPVTPGKPYAATARVKSLTNSRTCRVDIAWYNSIGSLLSQATGTPVASSNTVWTTLTCTGTPPAGTLYGTLLVYMLGNTSEVHNWDGFSLHRGTVAAWSSGGMMPQTAGTGYEVGWDRSTDGGTTWTQVRPMPVGSNPNSSFGGMWQAYTSFTADMFDLDCPRVGSVQYRLWGAAPLNGAPVKGAVGAAQSVTVPSDGSWWMRGSTGLLGWTGVMPVRAKRGSVSWSREEDSGVFRPFGRSTAVVVSGDMEGEDGSITLTVLSQAEWVNLNGILKTQAPIGLFDPDGSFKWIRLLPGGRSWTRKGTGSGNGWREVSLSYVEVDYSA